MAGGTSDFASVEIGDSRIDTWLSYTISSDLLRPADQFRLTIAVPKTSGERAALMSLLDAGSNVRVYIGKDITGVAPLRALQLTGIIDDRTVSVSRDSGTSIEVTGRDLAAHLVDSSVPPTLMATVGTTFADLVREAVRPWSIPVVMDAQASRDILTGRRSNTRIDRLQLEEARAAGIPPAVYSRQLRRQAEREGRPLDEVAGVEASDRGRRRHANNLTGSDIERLKVDEAKPNIGETVWEFLDRHARRLKLLMWFSPRGELILSSPDYDSTPLYRIVRRIEEDRNDPNNVISGTLTVNAADRYSEVTVYGRTHGRDAARSKIHATVKDETLPFYRPLIMHDQSARTTEEATKVATRQLSMHKLNAFHLDYTVKNHSGAGHVYAVDSIAEVHDEALGIEGRYYIVSRDFLKSREQGTIAQLKLVERGALVL